jgi:hypothetical protein
VNYDEYQVQVTVKGRSTDDNYYPHAVFDFEVGEISEYEAMQIARAAVRFYVEEVGAEAKSEASSPVADFGKPWLIRDESGIRPPTAEERAVAKLATSVALKAAREGERDPLGNIGFNGPFIVRGPLVKPLCSCGHPESAHELVEQGRDHGNTYVCHGYNESNTVFRCACDGYSSPSATEAGEEKEG